MYGVYTPQWQSQRSGLKTKQQKKQHIYKKARVISERASWRPLFPSCASCAEVHVLLSCAVFFSASSFWHTTTTAGRRGRPHRGTTTTSTLLPGERSYSHSSVSPSSPGTEATTLPTTPRVSATVETPEPPENLPPPPFRVVTALPGLSYRLPAFLGRPWTSCRTYAGPAG